MEPGGEFDDDRWPVQPLPGDVVGKWWCPVCGRPAHRIHRPGRPKVYCSNACRQRAYRHRCDERRRGTTVTTAIDRRGRTRWRTHAIRPTPDFVAGRLDTGGREISRCGAFVRRDRSRLMTHTDFVAGLGWSCERCTELGNPRVVDPDAPWERSWRSRDAVRSPTAGT